MIIVEHCNPDSYNPVSIKFDSLDAAMAYINEMMAIYGEFIYTLSEKESPN